MRKIPKDYVTAGSASKLTPEGKRQRFHLWKQTIDVRNSDTWGTEPKERPWNMEEFLQVLDCMRELIYAMAVPIINTHLAIQFNKRFPNFTFGNGRSVNTMNDYSDFIHEYNPQVKDALKIEDVRAMTHFVLYAIWGKSNHWAEKGERQILELLGFEYDGNRMCDGGVKKRKQRGGFGKLLLVKKIDMERVKVNESWSRCQFEKFFTRDCFKTPVKPSTKADKSHLRKYIISCKNATHKFDGTYLLLEGHH